MKVNSRTIALAMMLSAIVLSPIAAFAAAGEPVPGAEIYIELEPYDQPVGHGITDAAGKYLFKPQKTGIHCITIAIPRAFLKANAKKTYHLGTYHFRAYVKSGNRTTSHQFTVPAKALSDNPKSVLKDGGPFSESLSNIEDGIVIVVTLEDVADLSAPKK